MIWLLLLAMQGLPMTPLPTAMEPSINRYGECIFGRFRDGLIGDYRRAKRKSGAKVGDAALIACASIRSEAVKEANAALARDSRFSDPTSRLVFVQERFSGIDQLFREMAAGRSDPDNWK